MRSSFKALLNKNTKVMIHQQTETHFSAVAYVLTSLEIFMSAVTFKKEVINYQTTNNILTDGYSIERFTRIRWNQHLNEMGSDGNYGGEITLRAITNIFGIEIFVVSTLGQQGLVDIQPEDLEPLSPLILGDYTEGECFYHIVLEAKFNPLEEQSDPLGEKSDLITDKINFGENEINRSENEINSGENEIDRSENDISLRQNEINQPRDDINLGENKTTSPKNKVFSDEKELNQVSSDFE